MGGRAKDGGGDTGMLGDEFLDTGSLENLLDTLGDPESGNLFGSPGMGSPFLSGTSPGADARLSRFGEEFEGAFELDDMREMPSTSGFADGGHWQDGDEFAGMGVGSQGKGGSRGVRGGSKGKGPGGVKGAGGAGSRGGVVKPGLGNLRGTGIEPLGEGGMGGGQGRGGHSGMNGAVGGDWGGARGRGVHLPPRSKDYGWRLWAGAARWGATATGSDGWIHYGGPPPQALTRGPAHARVRDWDEPAVQPPDSGREFGPTAGEQCGNGCRGGAERINRGE